MSAATLISYVKSLFRRGRIEDDLSEELQFHLQNEIQKSITAGMTLEEARYAALRSFGGLDEVKEQCRELTTRSVSVDQVLPDARANLFRKSLSITSIAQEYISQHLTWHELNL